MLRTDFWGPRWASQPQIAKIAAILWGCHPDPRLGPILSPCPVQIRHVLCITAFRTHPGPKRAVLVPSWSRAFLPGLGVDWPKQTSWPLLSFREGLASGIKVVGLPSVKSLGRESVCLFEHRAPVLNFQVEGNARRTPLSKALIVGRKHTLLLW